MEQIVIAPRKIMDAKRRTRVKRRIVMNRFLVALSLAAALSTPALAMPGPRPDNHHQVQTRAEQAQSQARESQTNDPYWQPCQVSDYNTCE